MVLNRRSLAAALIAGFSIAASSSARAQAPELRVYAAGATKVVAEELAPLIERDAGVRLVLVFDTVGALRDRVLAGESPDVVMLSTPAIAAITEKRGAAAGRVSLGRTGVGLAVPRGRPTPPIDTPERLRAFLTAGGTIGHADPARGATAGTQFRKTVGDLGLQDALKDKLRVYPFGVEVIAALGRGELDVGVSQATEIVTHASVAFVGFLPDPHQVWTIYEAAALRDGDATRKFLAYLTTPAGAAAMAKSGFQPVMR